MQVQTFAHVPQKSDVLDSERHLAEVRDAIDEANKKLAEKQAELAKSSKLDDQIKLKEKKLIELAEKTNLVLDESNKLDGVIVGQKEQIEGNKTVINSQKSDIDRINSDKAIIHKEHEDLKGHHSALKDTVAASEKHLANLSQQVLETEKEHAQAKLDGKNRLVSINQQIDEAHIKLVEVKSKSDELERSHELKKAQFDRELATEKAKHDAELKVIHNQVEEAKQSLAETERKEKASYEKMNAYEEDAEKQLKKKQQAEKETEEAHKKLEARMQAVNIREEALHETHRAALVDIAKKAKAQKVIVDQALIEELTGK